MRCATAHFLAPPPWGSGERPKGQILLFIIKSQLQSQFQRFLTQSLCVYSQMKDIKHIRWDFNLATWVMPKGWDLGVLCGVGRVNFFRNSTRVSWCVSYLHEWHNFFGPRPLGPWRGAKRSNIIKSQLLSQFQRFLNQTLCVFSQMKDIKHIRRDFHLTAWAMPQWWDLGVLWGVERGMFF